MFNTSALAGVDAVSANQPSGITITFTPPGLPLAGSVSASAPTSISASTSAQAINAALIATTTGPVNISPPQASRILREINALPPERITAEIQQLKQAVEKVLAERENS
jgi:hypothetical protein